MARPKRKKIKLDEESVNNLFQEIYDDNHNIKAQITRLFTKWETKVKENGEVAAIGDQVVKLIMAQSKNQDQKLMILRYLKEVVYDNKGAGGGTKGESVPAEEQDNVSTDRRNELLNFVEKEIERKEKEKI